MFPLISRSSEELSEGVLEHVFPPDVNSQVLAPHPFVQPLQFLSEVPALHVKVQDARVVHQDGERSVGQRGGRLTQNLVQDRSVGL